MGLLEVFKKNLFFSTHVLLVISYFLTSVPYPTSSLPLNFSPLPISRLNAKFLSILSQHFKDIFNLRKFSPLTNKNCFWKVIRKFYLFDLRILLIQKMFFFNEKKTRTDYGLTPLPMLAAFWDSKQNNTKISN